MHMSTCIFTCIFLCVHQQVEMNLAREGGGTHGTHGTLLDPRILIYTSLTRQGFDTDTSSMSAVFFLGSVQDVFPDILCSKYFCPDAGSVCVLHSLALSILFSMGFPDRASSDDHAPFDVEARDEQCWSLATERRRRNRTRLQVARSKTTLVKTPTMMYIWLCSLSANS